MIRKRFEELKLSGTLPSPSGLGLAILKYTQDEESNVDGLVEILQADPAMTGRILKLANSAQLGGIEPVTQVRQAATRLGSQAVRGVALGFTLVSSNRSGVCERFDYDRYWSSSLACAVVAQELAGKLGQCDPAEAFTCSLLARIGMLALASVHPQAYAQILDETTGRGEADLLAGEERAFEINHWEVTAAMMTEWGLPKVFTSAVLSLGKQDFDASAEDERVVLMRQILLGADRGGELLLHDLAAIKCDPARSRREFTALRAELPLELEEVERLCDRANQQWREWSEMLRIPQSTMATEIDVANGLGGVQPAEPVLGGTGFYPVTPPVSLVAAATGKPGPIRVLVVDDDELIVRLISFHLRRAGFDVITASNGRQALEVALEHAPDIVVTDWMMPELSGIELCRSLRRMEAGRRTYVLILTAREDEDRVVDAFTAGADDYVVKPFNPRILLARIKAGQRLVELQQQVELDRQARARQIADLGLMTRRYYTASLTDVLTELPNRRYAISRLEQEWAASVTLGHPLSLVMIDIDHFKGINDQHGHDIGDHVLRRTAAVLRDQTRQGDVVCRLGGEEFLVINVKAELQSALHCAERLRRSVEANRIECGSFRGNVTVSLGVAERSAAVSSVDDFLRQVDNAVYQAKAAGRNTTWHAASQGGERTRSA